MLKLWNKMQLYLQKLINMLSSMVKIIPLSKVPLLYEGEGKCWNIIKTCEN